MPLVLLSLHSELSSHSLFEDQMHQRRQKFMWLNVFKLVLHAERNFCNFFIFTKSIQISQNACNQYNCDLVTNYVIKTIDANEFCKLFRNVFLRRTINFFPCSIITKIHWSTTQNTLTAIYIKLRNKRIIL